MFHVLLDIKCVDILRLKLSISQTENLFIQKQFHFTSEKKILMQ